MPPFTRDVPPSRILVVRLGAVGDVVRTLPAVRLLRRTWPGAHIAWAVEPGPGSVLAGQPDVDEWIVLERKAITRGLARLDPRALGRAWSFVRRLRAARPDLALDFQGSFKSGLVMRLSGAPVRVGFDRPFDREHAHLFANVRVALPRPRVHRVERAALLARAAGADDGPVVADLALTPEELAAGRAIVRRVAGSRTPIALAPFTSPKQAWKRYPLAHWGAVARGLAAAGHAVILVAGPGAEETAARRLAEDHGPGVFAVSAPPLRVLAGMIAACEMFVGGDTGPMHIAWSVGTPVVAVYGPTDPVLNAPWGEGHVVLAPPRPARRHDADPFPGITVELILSSALSLLARQRRPDRDPEALDPLAAPPRPPGRDAGDTGRPPGEGR